MPKGEDALLSRLARNAGIGFVSSVVSDTISNSLRVVKTCAWGEWRESASMLLPPARGAVASS